MSKMFVFSYSFYQNLNFKVMRIIWKKMREKLIIFIDLIIRLEPTTDRPTEWKKRKRNFFLNRKEKLFLANFLDQVLILTSK